MTFRFILFFGLFLHLQMFSFAQTEGKLIFSLGEGYQSVEEMQMTTTGSLLVFGDHKNGGYIAKVSANGELLWSQIITGGKFYGVSLIEDMVLAPNGTLHVLGGFTQQLQFGSHTQEADNKRYGYYAQLNTDGELIGPVQTFEKFEAKSIAAGPGGEIYLMGTFQHAITIAGQEIKGNYINALVLKFDAKGKLAWARQYGGTGENEVFASHIDLDGLLLFCIKGNDLIMGDSKIVPDDPTFQEARILIRIDGQGNIKQTQFFNFRGPCNTITTDPQGNVYLAGHFAGSWKMGNQSFDPDLYASTAFIASLSQDFKQLRWFQHDASEGASAVQDLKVFQGTCYFTGLFEGDLKLGNKSLQSVKKTKDLLLGTVHPDGAVLSLVGAGGDREDKGQVFSASPNQLWLGGQVTRSIQLGEAALSFETWAPKAFVVHLQSGMLAASDPDHSKPPRPQQTDPPVAETPVAETPVAETPVAETPPVITEEKGPKDNGKDCEDYFFADDSMAYYAIFCADTLTYLLGVPIDGEKEDDGNPGTGNNSLTGEEPGPLPRTPKPLAMGKGKLYLPVDSGGVVIGPHIPREGPDSIPQVRFPVAEWPKNASAPKTRDTVDIPLDEIGSAPENAFDRDSISTGDWRDHLGDIDPLKACLDLPDREALICIGESGVAKVEKLKQIYEDREAKMTAYVKENKDKISEEEAWKILGDLQQLGDSLKEEQQKLRQYYEVMLKQIARKQTVGVPTQNKAGNFEASKEALVYDARWGKYDRNPQLLVKWKIKCPKKYNPQVKCFMATRSVQIDYYGAAGQLKKPGRLLTGFGRTNRLMTNLDLLTTFRDVKHLTFSEEQFSVNYTDCPGKRTGYRMSTEEFLSLVDIAIHEMGSTIEEGTWVVLDLWFALKHGKGKPLGIAGASAQYISFTAKHLGEAYFNLNNKELPWLEQVRNSADAVVLLTDMGQGYKLYKDPEKFCPKYLQQTFMLIRGEYKLIKGQLEAE